jgi:GNAT superfamily N-acetyltransferase
MDQDTGSIRRLEAVDIPAVVRLIAAGDLRMSREEIESILADHDACVYCTREPELEPGQGPGPEPGPVVSRIVGLACTKRYSRDYGLRIYVDPAHRGQGIGGRLYEHVQPAFAGPGPDRVTATYRSDAGPGREFFRRRGFQPWFDMVHLRYDGPRRPELPANMAVRQYEDGLFEAFSSVIGEAFVQMRRAHDFRPYDVREIHQRPGERQQMLAGAANRFVTFGAGGAPVGGAVVEGDFVDVIGVPPAHQGKGYGRALMDFCVNLLRDRGHAIVRTSVLNDNIPAKTLYLRMGFEHVVSFEDATLQPAVIASG